MIEPTILQFDWFGLTSNLNTFLVAMIAIIGGLGAAIAQKLTLAGMASFILLVYIAMNTDLFIFNGMLYTLITIILFVLSVRIYKLVYGDSGGENPV